MDTGAIPPVSTPTPSPSSPTPSPQRKRLILFIGLVLAVLMTAFFAVRLTRRFRAPPPQESIRGWMSIPHVEQSYRLRPGTIFKALGVASPASGSDRRTIQTIAKDLGVSEAALIQRIENIIAAERMRRQPNHPPPHGPTPTTPPTGS
jgi:hypothetical protein